MKLSYFVDVHLFFFLQISPLTWENFWVTSGHFFCVKVDMTAKFYDVDVPTLEDEEEGDGNGNGNKVTRSSRRIYQGIVVDPGKYTWMASMHLFAPPGSKGEGKDKDTHKHPHTHPHLLDQKPDGTFKLTSVTNLRKTCDVYVVF